jgi:hypothetical protein
MQWKLYICDIKPSFSIPSIIQRGLVIRALFFLVEIKNYYTHLQYQIQVAISNIRENEGRN